MANLPISQLPLAQAAQLDENDVFAVVNQGETKKVTLQNLAGAIFSNGTGTVGDAENGLNVLNGKVRLGGTLKEDTLIDQLGKNLRFGNGNFLSEGAWNSAYPTLTPSFSQKFIWAPSRYAFRAGNSNDGSWDEANVGYGSVAFGNNNLASGDASLAHGLSSKATSFCSFALGSGAISNAPFAMAMGSAVQALSSGSLATGDGSIAKGYNSVSFGSGSISAGYASIAVGHDAKTGDYLGSPNSSSSGANAIAVGANVHAKGIGSVAFGNGSLADGFLSSAIGDNVKAYGVASFAQGCNVEAGNPNGNTPLAWAVGTNSKTYATHSFAFGNNARVGIDRNDNTVNSELSFSFGNNSVALKQHAFSFGNGTIANGVSSFAFGNQAQATNTQAIAFGFQSKALGIASVAMGTNARSSGNGSFAIGNGVVSSGNESFSQGWNSSAVGNQAIALGCQVVAGSGELGQAAVAIGDNAKAFNDHGVALGSFIEANAKGSFVLGLGAISPTAGIDPLINNQSDSLMVGFNSDVPTMFVSGSNGAGTTGRVHIGDVDPTSDASSKLVVRSTDTVPFQNDVTSIAEAASFFHDIDGVYDESQVSPGIQVANGVASTNSNNSVGISMCTRSATGNHFQSCVALTTINQGDNKADFAIQLEYDSARTMKEVARFQYNNNGDGRARVGIGTNSPREELEVNGNVRITGNLIVDGTAPGGGGSSSPTATKGDVIVNNGSTDVALSVGVDGQTLVADSNSSAGVKWESQPKQKIFYPFSLAGEAQFNDTAFVKASSNNNAPSGIATTNFNNPGIQDGQVDPYIIPANSTVKSIVLTLGKGAVQPTTPVASVAIRLSMYKNEFNTRVLVGTFDVPLDSSKINGGGNINIDSFQTAQLSNLATPLQAGDLIGIEFDSVQNDASLLVSASRVFVSMETELN